MNWCYAYFWWWVVFIIAGTISRFYDFNTFRIPSMFGPYSGKWDTIGQILIGLGCVGLSLCVLRWIIIH